MRTPTSKLDSLSIFCHIMRRVEKKCLEDIGQMIAKNHVTVIYHLKRYDGLMKVDKKFQQTFKDFRMSDFVETYSQKKIQLEPLTVADVTPFLIH